MKSKLLFSAALSAALLMSGCGNKQDQNAATPNAANAPNAAEKTVAAKTDNSFAKEPALWMVKDEDTVVYLFGTVHLLKPETKWQNPRFEAAFAASDAIYQEADVTSDEATQGMMKILPGLAMYSDGRKLSDVLDDEEEREVKEAADIVGVPMAGLEGMQPWFAGLSLMQVQIMKQGYKPDSGVETVINAMATDSGKDIRYFETAAQQLQLLGGLPEDSQIEFLVQGAIAIEDDPDMLNRLVADWAEGDVASIGEIMSGVDDWGDQTVYETLLVNRNKDWAVQITDLMDDEAGTFFVAVGAGHLAGEDSLVALLRANGETVTRQ